MKYAQYLERNAVEEWRKAYINYRGLKKLIKKVAAHHRQRLEILASLGENEAEAGGSGIRRTRSKGASRNAEEGFADLRDRVLASQGGSQYGATGNGISDLTASPPPPHEVPPISLDGTGIYLCQSVRDKLQAGDFNIKKSSLGNVGPQEVVGQDSQREQDVESRLRSSSSKVGLPRADIAPAVSNKLMPTPSNPNNAGEDEQQQSKKSADPSPSSPVTRKSGKSYPSSVKTSKKLKHHHPRMDFDEYVGSVFDPSERIFFLALDSELERISDFYEGRLTEARTRFEELVAQLRELAEHRRKYKESHQASAGPSTMPWTQTVDYLSNAAPSGLRRSLRQVSGRRKGTDDSAKTVSPERAKGHTTALGDDSREEGRLQQRRDTTTESTATAVEATRSSEAAELPLSSEDEGAKRRSLALERMARLAAEEGQEDSQANGNAAQIKAAKYDPVRYKAARHKLKEAIAEFYRGLELIRSFKVLNRDGFGKILKKFDKTLDRHTSVLYYRARVEPSILVQSHRIDDLLRSTEDAFAGFFEHGDRKKALDRLRMQGTPQNNLRTHHGSASRTGFFIGISLCAIVGGLVEAMKPEVEEQIPSWSALLRVYGALFLPTLFALLFGLNLAGFAYARINTTFIFEWDARHSLDYHQYFEIPAFLFLLLSLAFWVSFLNPFPDAIAPTTWPLVWLVVMLVFLLNPLPIFNPKSRGWFIKSILRVFGGGFLCSGSVQFRDFFLGDELNSIAWSFSILWFIGCEYQRDWRLPECQPNDTYWTAALSVIPALLRLGQCVRRWIDSKYYARIHLLNAAKYSTAVFYYFFYIHWRKEGDSGRNGTMALWILFACFQSLATMLWDVLFDFSLLHVNSKYPLLRDELVYEDVWPMYYVAIITNSILRCGWIIYVLPGPASTLTRSFLVAFLEVLRRFQWNFYRVGNEHQGNVDQYRALRDTPLPYTISKATSSEEGIEKDQSPLVLKMKALRKKWMGDEHSFAPADPVARAEDEDDEDEDDDEDDEDEQMRSGHRHPQQSTQASATSRRSHHRRPGTGATGATTRPTTGNTYEPQEGASDAANNWRRAVSKVQGFLVPDRGGYSARGPRLDDQAAAKGAWGRDYAPRRQEGDAVVDSDDEGDTGEGGTTEDSEQDSDGDVEGSSGSLSEQAKRQEERTSAAARNGKQPGRSTGASSGKDYGSTSGAAIAVPQKAKRAKTANEEEGRGGQALDAVGRRDSAAAMSLSQSWNGKGHS